MERLKHRREFLRVAGAGRKWVAPGLILQVCPRDGEKDERLAKAACGDRGVEGIRVGFTVSRKVGGAVTRNRVRRRLRAVAETVLPAHAAGGNDYVIIGRAATMERSFPALIGDLERALKGVTAYRKDQGEQTDHGTRA